MYQVFMNDKLISATKSEALKLLETAQRNGDRAVAFDQSANQVGIVDSFGYMRTVLIETNPFKRGE